MHPRPIQTRNALLHLTPPPQHSFAELSHGPNIVERVPYIATAPQDQMTGYLIQGEMQLYTDTDSTGTVPESSAVRSHKDL